MTTAIQTHQDNAVAVLERVVIRGDLSGLKEGERIDYYRRVCDSLGLNPLTKPFDYITLNGKLVLYAKRDCTDQLRAIRGVSVFDVVNLVVDGVYVVTVKVRDREDRHDAATGAVSIAGLKGEALANAMMKAETKAKRRATLSICGLGFMDEAEIGGIEEAAREAATGGRLALRNYWRTLSKAGKEQIRHLVDELGRLADAADAANGGKTGADGLEAASVGDAA